MHLRMLVLFLMLMGADLPAAQLGMSKADLIQELGRPTSTLARSGREILIYPNGVRVELEKGVVVAAKGLAALEEKAATAPAAAETAPAHAAEGTAAKEPSAPVADEEVETPLTPAQQAELAKMEKESADQQAKARAEMEKAIVAMEQPSPPPEAALMRKPPFSVLRLVSEFAMRWVFMLAVLKIASKYWDSEIPWKGLAIAASADVATRMLLSEVGTRLLGMPSLFYADEAVATFVLVFVIRQVSFNRSLGKAVEIALSVKVFSTMVGGFLFSLALNFLF